MAVAPLHPGKPRGAELQASVIIPVYQDWERLARCLQALERQSLPDDAFEIIIANNEDTPDCPLERMPRNARLIHEPTPGSYAARNAAVAVACGTNFFFTDSDCVPEPQWLANGLEALRASPGARITGPVTIFRDAGTSYCAYVHDLYIAFPQADNVAAGKCVTANLVVARELFHRVGWFDQAFSGGDVEWNLRAQAAGIPIFLIDSVRVSHPARRTLREIFRKKRRTAGAAHQSVTMGALIVECIKPPIRRLMMLRRSGAAWPHALIVFVILWISRFIRAQEVGFIRLGLKQPSRS